MTKIKKTQNLTRVAVLISGHLSKNQSQSTSILALNPVLLLQNTFSIFSCAIFLSNFFMYWWHLAI